jgi:hypothetical protein
VALWLLTHGSDGRQEALESLRSIGIDAQGIRLLARCQGFESRELAVQDRDIRL